MDPLAKITMAVMESLDAMEIPHALAGGLAANAWILEENVYPTFDVDVAALATEAAPLDRGVLEVEISTRTRSECFHSADLPFKKATIARFMCLPEKITVDVILAEKRYSAMAVSRAGIVVLEGREFPVLAPEDAILFKGLAGRNKDLGPIAAIVASRKIDRKYVERWARRLGIWRFVSRAMKG